MKKFKWVIDKSMNFEYGHTVWAQRLDHPELSISCDCACKHLHGHSGTVKVFLGADELDQSAMVTDFKNLNFVKEFLDNVLDHRFMIDINDPRFEIITSVDVTPELIEDVNENAKCKKLFTPLPELLLGPTTAIYDPVLEEHLESFVVTNFVPTSENICKALFEVVQEQIKHVATVVAIEFWETAKSHCRYEG